MMKMTDLSKKIASKFKGIKQDNKDSAPKIKLPKVRMPKC